MNKHLKRMNNVMFTPLKFASNFTFSPLNFNIPYTISIFVFDEMEMMNQKNKKNDKEKMAIINVFKRY